MDGLVKILIRNGFKGNPDIVIATLEYCTTSHTFPWAFYPHSRIYFTSNVYNFNRFEEIQTICMMSMSVNEYSRVGSNILSSQIHCLHCIVSDLSLTLAMCTCLHRCNQYVLFYLMAPSHYDDLPLRSRSVLKKSQINPTRSN